MPRSLYPFFSYLNGILAILTLVFCFWIGLLLKIALGDTVDVIFTINIVAGSLSVPFQPSHWCQNTSTLLYHVRFLHLSLNVSFFYQHCVRVFAYYATT